MRGGASYRTPFSRPRCRSPPSPCLASADDTVEFPKAILDYPARADWALWRYLRDGLGLIAQAGADADDFLVTRRGA